MLTIVMDARRIRDFGIGTYIRNLIHTLATVDQRNRYVLVTSAADSSLLGGLPQQFETATCNVDDSSAIQQISFPSFLRRFSADVYHIPLNRVPFFMPRPYVVTIHDIASLLFDPESGFKMNLRRYLFRRGLLRAARVMAVSAATRRDVVNTLGVPSERVGLVYSAPAPEFFRHGRAMDARAAGPRTEERERLRILERYQIQYPFLLYAGNIRPQKNIPRLVEAFAVVRNEPVGRGLCDGVGASRSKGRLLHRAGRSCIAEALSRAGVVETHWPAQKPDHFEQIQGSGDDAVQRLYRLIERQAH